LVYSCFLLLPFWQMNWNLIYFIYICHCFYKYFENTPKICGSDICDAFNPFCVMVRVWAMFNGTNIFQLLIIRDHLAPGLTRIFLVGFVLLILLVFCVCVFLSCVPNVASVLWIVYYWLPLLFSLMFIYSYLLNFAS